jgi:hypothetical protein
MVPPASAPAGGVVGAASGIAAFAATFGVETGEVAAVVLRHGGMLARPETTRESGAPVPGKLADYVGVASFQNRLLLRPGRRSKMHPST